MLIAAGILHLTATVSIFIVGHYRLAPGTFDSDGIGISFAVDGIHHRTDTVALTESLRRGELVDWFTAGYPLHDKLYSICFAILGPCLGFNIISVEPLNLLCYLGILFLVYKLGEEVFSAEAGRLAAIAVALWPSFLLHTTQLLRDPLFVLGLLAFVLVLVRLLSREYEWARMLLLGGSGGVLAAGLWLTRGSMGVVAAAIALLGAALLIAAQFGKRPIQIRNLVGMALLVAVTFVAQKTLPRYSGWPAFASENSANARSPVRPRNVDAPVDTTKPVSEPMWLVRRVSFVRARFIMRYQGAGSNVDEDRQLETLADIIRYLPRAAVIGSFAPFPNMWFTRGKEVGLRGRLLAGIESIFFYAFEGLALFALWSERRRISVWLLAGSAAVGTVALGLVVTNIGALFRLRYGFAILVLILGAVGAVQLLAGPFRRYKASTPRPRAPASFHALKLGRSGIVIIVDS